MADSPRKRTRVRMTAIEGDSLRLCAFALKVFQATRRAFRRMKSAIRATPCSIACFEAA